MICDWWISIRLCVSVFQSSLLVIIIIMIDSSKNEIVKTASELYSLRDRDDFFSG